MMNQRRSRTKVSRTIERSTIADESKQARNCRTRRYVVAFAVTGALLLQQFLLEDSFLWGRHNEKEEPGFLKSGVPVKMFRVRNRHQERRKQGNNRTSVYRPRQKNNSQIVDSKGNKGRSKEHVKLQNLTSLTDDLLESNYEGTKETDDEAYQARGPIMDLLERAGLQIEREVLDQLPRWSDVTELYGSKPVILGMETCQRFRKHAPREERYIGVAGQMNSGTNALGKYLFSNLKIEENEAYKGMLSKVPWNKHGWVGMRNEYKQSIPDDPTLVLPVVIVRDPYFWAHSMCESQYTMEWEHDADHCPNLVNENAVDPLEPEAGVPVRIRWGKVHSREWKSLAHVWSEWHREYYEAANTFPRLMIRFEDLLFHAPKVLEQIRQCAGADWKTEQFVFHTDTVKVHPYFSKYKTQSGMVSAMIRYGQDKGRRIRKMTLTDLEYAQQYLDSELMEIFHYKNPDMP